MKLDSGCIKKYLTTAFACTLLCLALVSCSSRYHKKDVLGKTSAEIINLYGPFDFMTMDTSEDGLYRSCRCGYTIKEARAGFFGTSDEEMFFIVFDEDGIAVGIFEGVRPLA